MLPQDHRDHGLEKYNPWETLKDLWRGIVATFSLEIVKQLGSGRVRIYVGSRGSGRVRSGQSSAGSGRVQEKWPVNNSVEDLIEEPKLVHWKHLVL